MLWFVLVVTSSYAYEIGPYPNQAACGFVGASVHAGLEEKPRPVLATVMCVPKLVFGVAASSSGGSRASFEVGGQFL